MEQQSFKPRIFLGIDFTPRKRYRAEIEKLKREVEISNRVNADLRRSFAAGEKDRNDLLKRCAEERNLRYAAEAELQKYLRKRGANGKFIKDE